MEKNSLSSLNNFLFGQLERLDDPELTAEGLRQEIDRSKAIAQVASQIVANANTMLAAQRLVMDTDGRSKVEVPKTLIGE